MAEDSLNKKELLKRIKKVEKENKKLKQAINLKEKETKNKETQNKISRRDFLKKAGMGAIGLGALSLTPGSALNVKDEDLNVYTGSNQDNLTEYLAVESGTVKIKNTDLTIQGNTAATQNWVGSNYNNYTFSESHTDLTNISPNDHHNKTSSASELTDVSPDSTSDAHHSKTTSSEIEHDSTAGGTSGNPHSNSASTNHDNTAHSRNYTTRNENIENFSTSSLTSGEVPTSQGDGTLSMQEISGGVPSGTIVMWNGGPSNVPSGWTLCDGNNKNGQTVPDLRNKFIVGAGDQYTNGETGGQKQVTLTEQEIPSHNHDITSNNDNGGDSITAEGDASSPGVGSISTSSSGGDQAHENRPPYYALAYIMKL